MSEYQLAQLNIGNPAYPLDSPELKDFIDNLDLINSLAERSDGFVWRLQTPAGNATEVDAAVFKNYGDNTIVNMSTWSDACLLYTSPSPRDATLSRMPSSA